MQFFQAMPCLVGLSLLTACADLGTGGGNANLQADAIAEPIRGMALIQPSDVGFAKRQTGVAGRRVDATSISCTFARTPSPGDLIAVGIDWWDGTEQAVQLAVADTNLNRYAVADHTADRQAAVVGQVMQAYLLAAPANASRTIIATFSRRAASAKIWCDDFAVNGGMARYESGAAGSGSGVVSKPSISVAGSHRLLYAVVTSQDSAGAPQQPWIGNDAGRQSGSYAAYVLNAFANTPVRFTGTANRSYNAVGMSFGIDADSNSQAAFAAKPHPATAAAMPSLLFPTRS